MTTSKNQNVAYYEILAPQYDDVVKRSHYKLPDLLPTIIKNHIGMSEIPRLRVLDIGIGTGLSSIWLGRKGAVVTGLDASNTMLSITNSKNFAESLILWDLAEGNLPDFDKKFDLVICLGVFEFIFDIENFIRHVSLNIVNGGFFILATRDKDINQNLKSEIIDHYEIDSVAYRERNFFAVFHPVAMIKSNFDRYGFAIIEEMQIVAYTSPTQFVETKNRLFVCKFQSHG